MTSKDVLQLPVDNNIINKTLENTVRKYLYTIQNLTYTRTPVELLDNLYMGDIAKNSIFDYLKDKVDDILIDYDEIRTDNFEQADPGWDFKIGNRPVKIEVKSSLPPKVDIGKSATFEDLKNEIINNRDVKITASHDNGKTFIEPENLDSEIHIQIYFFDVSVYKKGYDNPSSLYEDIKDSPHKIKPLIKSDKYNTPYYFGFSTKQEIINYKNENEKNNTPTTWTFSWTDRWYWRSPLLKAHNIRRLIDLIYKYKDSK